MKNAKKKIFILGGHGTVGKQITKILVEMGYFVVIAGRNREKAKKVINEFGSDKVEFVQLDIFKELPNLEGIDSVVSCLDLDNTKFASYCINNKCNFIDITANDTCLKKLESLNSDAIKNNVHVLLSVGLAPGATNLLVTELALNKEEDNKEYIIGIQLGCGEKHGKEAINWTISNIFSWNKKIKNRKLNFNSEKYSLAIPFDFSDQYTIERRSGLRVSTYLSLVPEYFTWGISFLRNFPLKPLIPFFLRCYDIFNKVMPSYNDYYSILVESVHSTSKPRKLLIKGTSQSLFTAAFTVSCIDLIRGKGCKSGVNHTFEIFNLTDIWKNTQKYADCELIDSNGID